MNMTSFENAFSDRAGSSRLTCACGREFYNDDSSWSWDEGELEALQEDPEATELDWSIGRLTFEGVTYAMDCDCWHERAERIMRFIDSHGHKIVDYLREEKARKVREAEISPVFEETL